MASSETSTPRTKPKRTFTRSIRRRRSVVESPAESPRSRKNPSVEPTETEYRVRDIIDEDETRYLIDWEDSPGGNKYVPTWEPKENANSIAIQDWQDRKKYRPAPTSNRSVPRQDEHHIFSTSSTQSSEPIRKPGDRGTKRLARPQEDESSSLEKPPVKRQRRAGTAQSARFFLSQEDQTVVTSSVDETEGSLEDKEPTSVLGVVIPINEDFPRDDYLKFDRILPVSQNSEFCVDLRTPEKPVARSVQEEEEATVPDSQELFDSLDCNTTDTHVSVTRLDVPEPELYLEVAANDIPARDTRSDLPRSHPVLSGFQSDELVFQTQNPRTRIDLDQDISHNSAIQSCDRPSPRRVNQHTSRITVFELLEADKDTPRKLSVAPAPVGQVLCESDYSWQAAQAISRTPHSLRSIEASTSDWKVSPDTPSGPSKQSSQAPQEDSQGSRRSALSQIDANAHISTSFKSSISQGRQTAESPKSSQVVALSQPFNSEYILASIEQEDLDEFQFATQEQLSLLRPSPPSCGLPEIPDTYKGRYPLRPDLPSDIDMADSAETPARQLSFAERLAIARARSEAEVRATRSPSVIPPRNPSPPPVPTHDMLPLKEPVKENLSPEGPNLVEPQDEVDEEEPESDGMNEFPLPDRPMEYYVLLPMVSMVRDIYKEAIKSHRRDIQAFLGDEKVNSEIIRNIDKMIGNLNMLCDHQDLISDETATQAGLSSPIDQAKWAENISTKCLLVRQLLDKLRQAELHIAILARPGKMLDILESILIANKHAYERPDKPSHSGEVEGALKVTLLPTGVQGVQYNVKHADAVIAFDSTFQEGERYSKILRAHTNEPDRLSPLITLLITSSAEHIDLCLPKSSNVALRNYKLLHNIAIVYNDTGSLDVDMPEPTVVAAMISQYLRDGVHGPWPLPANPPITDLEDLESPSEPESGPATQSQDGYNARQTSVQAAKRPHDEFESDATKRIRVTGEMELASSNGDIDRIDGTTGFVSQRVDNTASEFLKIKEVATLDDSISEQIETLLGKVKSLEESLNTKAANEAEFKAQIKALESQLAAYVKSIHRIQPKYQEALNERAQYQAERDTSLALSARYKTQLDSNRETIATLEAQLVSANTALLGSSIPEIAELANTRLELSTLKKEKEKADKKLATTNQTLDYMRETYQQQNSVVDLANDLRNANAEIERLKHKANDNILRIHEIQRDNERAEREARIDDLEVQLADREAELTRKTEELRIKTNGRRETRGQSIPRSPRLGGTLSPRTRTVGTFGTSGSRSRQGSPTPRDLMRPQALFQDPVLFPSQGSSRRWEHLREGP